MLVSTKAQRWRFLIALAVGFAVAFVLLPWGADLVCELPQQHTGTPKTNTAAQQNGSQTEGFIESEIPASKGQSAASNQVRKIHWPMRLLCGEMKLTDLALAFFTYTLAVIGWFTLRSTEHVAEALERAYIFHGYSPFEFRNNQATFGLTMTNTGRMPGAVKRVGYKFLSRSSLPPTRDQRDWEWDNIPYDFIVKPNTGANIRRFLSFRDSHIFVTFIEYEDLLTKRMHTSWMAMHISPSAPDGEQISRAGGDIWNDWD